MEPEQHLGPPELLVVDMVRLVVHHDQVRNGGDPLEQGTGEPTVVADRSVSEQRLHRVRRFAGLRTGVELLDVGQEQVADARRLAGLPAQDHPLVELPLPGRWDQREPSEDSIGLEVLPQSLVNDHIRRHDQEVRRERRARDQPAMEVRPDDGHRHEPGLAGAGGHSDGIAPESRKRQILGLLSHPGQVPADSAPAPHGRCDPRRLLDDLRAVWFPVSFDQLRRIALAEYLHQPGQRFDGLPLAEVEPERRAETRDLVLVLEPVTEEIAGDLGRAGIAVLPPAVHRLPEARDQHQVARAAAGIVHPPACLDHFVLHQEGARRLPRPPPGNLGQRAVVGNGRRGHGQRTSRSKAREVSLPKMSTALTSTR